MFSVKTGSTDIVTFVEFGFSAAHFYPALNCKKTTHIYYLFILVGILIITKLLTDKINKVCNYRKNYNTIT